MRSKLGRIVTLCVAGTTLVVASASTASAGTEPTTTTSAPPETTEPPPTGEPAPTTTTTSSTTTTTTTTTTTPPTTTEPPPLVIDLPEAPVRVTPSRGTAAQVTDTLPPPPTTTTLPPEWVLPPNSGSGRRVVYSKSRMRVWTVESDGTVSKTHLVSGRRTWNQPSPGSYQVFSRSRHTCNINNPHICWRFMVRFTKGPGGDNIGFHEIPTNTRTGHKLQSLSQLGQALSGGCVRQAPNDAAYMWNWAPIGTPVVVLG